nr:uncharacterized protein LOC117683989 [Crassostrea gigas]
MRYLVRKWKRATRVGFPVMGGTVDLQQGYAPNSNSFSPPCINTQSRLNGFGPFNSLASSPLHSSVHQSPYSASYLSSSFTQRDLLIGASPYHSLGGASSGYHVNSNGVTNGISSYQSVGGFLIVTMSTAISLSIPHCPRGTTAANYTPLLQTQVLEEKLFPLLLPTKVGHSPLIRRVRIRKASFHDDYISQLNLRICIRDLAGWILVLQIKVISTEIGVRSREPCYNFVFTVSLSDLDLHWLHTL